MPHEIVTIQVGQCGNNIGLKFWETLCNEHGVSSDGKLCRSASTAGGEDEKKEPAAIIEETKEEESKTSDPMTRFDIHKKLHVYFQSISDDTYTARNVLVDLEPSILEGIKGGTHADLFAKDAFVDGSCGGAGNNWAKGHYTAGEDIIDTVMERVRKEMEATDFCQGVQLFHSLGGGTGSGLGSRILLRVRDDYPDYIEASYSVFPSEKMSDFVVIEPMNAILTLNQIIENTEETFVIDNEGLYNITQNVLKLKKDPTYFELNHLVSLVMSGVTSSLRFPANFNSDMRKMGVNLVPFPRLHFFLLSQAPLFASEETDGKVDITSLSDITEQMWNGSHFFANCKPEDGKYLAAVSMYRGSSLTEEQIDKQYDDSLSKSGKDFVEWIPSNIKASKIDVPPFGSSAMSGTLIANTTALKTVFQRIKTQFDDKSSKRTFIHLYHGEGMEEGEIEEAGTNVRDLIMEYQDHQDAVVDLSDDTDEEDDSDEEDSDEDDEEEEDES